MPSDKCECGSAFQRVFCGRPICDKCFYEFMSQNDRMEQARKMSLKQGEPLKYEKVNAINCARDRYDLKRKLQRRG